MRSERRMKRALVAVFALAASFAAACGHPATVEECERILHKTADLKLKEQEINPELFELRKREFLDQNGDDLIAKCKGKRITKSALACIDRAETAAQVERCLW